MRKSTLRFFFTVAVVFLAPSAFAQRTTGAQSQSRRERGIGDQW